MRPLASLLALAALTVGGIAVSTSSAGSGADSTVSVQILGINDFHGYLEPPTGENGRIGAVEAGGAEYLATHLRRLERGHPHSILVSAGDLFGHSPALSSAFGHEPTVEAANAMGLDIEAVGNHELDAGVDELRRLRPRIDADVLAANVVANRGPDTGRSLFPPYAIRTFDGVDVAFIGMTLQGTPYWTGPAPVTGWAFRDEADTANALVPELQDQGVEAIVVVLHEGGDPAALDVDGCNRLAGPIVDIVGRLDDEVDLVLSGHTHEPYNCVIDGTPVTSASSFGRVVTDVDLRLDRGTGEVTGVTAHNVVVTRDVAPDPAITRLIDRYRAAAA
jgi:5'-nucleotidase